MIALVAQVIWLIWSWLELVVLTLVLYVWAWMPRKFTEKYFHGLFRLWCAFFVRALGVKLRLHEKNRQPLPEKYILIANHPSALEDVGIPTLFNVYPLAKEGVRTWWLAGRINVAAGTVFVKRDDRESRHQAVDSLIALLDKGKNIAMFPEGGCKGKRIYKEFQAGAFDIAMRTGVPIVPVFLQYEAQETFEWRDPSTLLEKMWHFMSSQNNRANYYVYDAIDPGDYKDKKVFAEAIRLKYLAWQEKYLD